MRQRADNLDALQLCASMVYIAACVHSVPVGCSRRQYDCRLELDVYASPNDVEPAVRGALVYIATPSSHNWLGPAPLPAIAAQVVRSSGPSGPNHEYLLRLAECMRQVHFPSAAPLALHWLCSSLYILPCKASFPFQQNALHPSSTYCSQLGADDTDLFVLEALVRDEMRLSVAS